MVERVVKQELGDLFLPPGFRFHPTDEEVITSYLLQKFLNPSFSPRAIGEVNLNRCEPWDLPGKAKMGEKEWYFFCHKDMKYPTGSRTNRATKVGYWKATGRDREIFKPTSAGRELVGMKKTLVFYMGRAPRGTKTNWVMHEFRLDGKSRQNTSLHHSPKDEWVVCKVFHKNNGEHKKQPAVEYSAGTPDVSSISVDATADDDDFLDSMMDPMYFNSTSSLPDMKTTFNTAAAPYTYTLTDTTSQYLHQQAAVANPTVPTSSSYGSSWNLLPAGHPMGSYNLHDQQAMMEKALRSVVSPIFASGLQSSSVTGIPQQNSLRQDYGGSLYATGYLTSSAAASATPADVGQASKKNLGD